MEQTQMNVLVVGGGGREHAIAQALAQSPGCKKLYCAPGNAGTAQIAQNLPIAAADIEGVVRACEENAIHYVVVAPDDPLAMGMVDALKEKGIAAFGPSQAAAAIESSKVFAKDLMRRYGIPTADYEIFSSPQEAAGYIEKRGRFPVVIKADGLALGKGVIIAGDMGKARDALRTIMQDKAFGKSGDRVVVEDFLTGPEVSVLCFTDSKTIVPMVSSMDHKRAFDGDEGPNTGGMGVVAPNPHYTPQIAQECMDTIFRPTVEAMNREGRPFSGCLYFGLMLTPDGPRVIEYNCRFGDPETQAVLPLLETPLLEVMLAVSEGRLDKTPVRFRDAASACVVLASAGYPGSYRKSLPIEGLDGDFGQDVHIYHAGTALVDGTAVTSGGRVLGVQASAPDLPKAIQRAYDAAGKIRFEGARMRTDIGARALEAGK